MRDLHKRPGNARVAVALLEVLDAQGDGGRRALVDRALGDQSALRRRRADWIRPEMLREIFEDAAVDGLLARRIGRALVAPRGMALLLFHAGIATPEKAYRRVDQLLARERPGDRFVAFEVHEDSARIEFYPKDPRRDEEIFCSVRQGMLEALPTLYGLLPANARQVECAHRGGAKCAFEVEWHTVPRTWLVTGVLAGAGAGFAIGAAVGGGLLGPLGWAIAAALALSVLGGAAGRSIDLARQLRAVAGGRIGRLALLDQLDSVLGEKIDELAKLEHGHDAALRANPDPVRAERRRRERGAAGAVSRELLDRFDAELAAMQGSLARLANGGGNLPDELVLCNTASRGLRAVGVELSEGVEAAGDEGRSGDLVEIVRRGIAAARSSQAPRLEIALSVEVESAPIRCHPFQLEQVVIQLLMNAAEAVRGEGQIDVTVRTSPDGFELLIADQGEGLDPEILDRLFDPFFEPTAARAESGLGLTLCYRVVDRHGGELSVQSEPGHGTTVTVMLPADWNESLVERVPLRGGAG